MHKWQNKIFLIIVILAVAARFILFLINSESNDDHVTPILLWMENGIYPQVHDCFECFQPPLFYGLVKETAELSNLTEFDEIRRIFQIINLALSFIILWLIIDFHNKLKVDSKYKVALIGFWALNPKLIAIGSQATNDTIIIVLGMLFGLLLFNYLTIKRTTFGLVLVSLVAFTAALSKGTGLVFVVILVLALVYSLFQKQTRKTQIISLIVIIGLPIIVGSTGGYYQKYQKFGDPFIINQNKAPKPNWITPDTLFNGRKGVTTITESFLSFKLESLIKQPYNINSGNNYPDHRKSFWTQLYGQYSNALFERHPWSWISSHPDMLNIARLNYITSLPLFILFIYLFFITFLKGVKILIFERLLNLEILHSLFLLAMVSFTIKYSYDYRDFSNMKIIFIYPSLLSMIWIFHKGFIKRSLLLNTINILVWTSIAGYLINMTFLIVKLW